MTRGSGGMGLLWYTDARRQPTEIALLLGRVLHGENPLPDSGRKIYEGKIRFVVEVIFSALVDYPH